MSTADKHESTLILPSTRDEHALDDTVLSEQHRVVLTDEQWSRFVQALDRPSTSQPRLEALLQEKSVFD